MKYIYILAFSICLFLNCSNNTDKFTLNLTSDKIGMNEKMKTMLKQFVRENPCKNCINEIYINKIFSIENIDFKTIITLQQIPFNKKDFIKLKPKPLLSINIDSCTFFIYNGMEDYFDFNYEKIDTISKEEGSKFVSWTIIDTKDTLIIKKKGEHPFSPFPSPDTISIRSVKRTD